MITYEVFKLHKVISGCKSCGIFTELADAKKFVIEQAIKCGHKTKLDFSILINKSEI